jgi:bifunctional enzyme CysN/CysC
MSERPMRPGTTYLIKHATHQVTAQVSALHGKIDVNTLEQQPATSLALNEIGPVTLTAARPLLFDPYLDSRTMGSFILIDRLTNATVGAGMIRSSAERAAQAAVGGRSEQSLVTLEERSRRLGHQPATVWLGGLPSAVIGPVAFALERRLFDDGRTATVVDPAALGGDVDATRAAELARLLNGLGFIVIVAMPADSPEPRRAAEARIGAPFLDASVGAGDDADPTEAGWVARILAALQARGTID